MAKYFVNSQINIYHENIHHIPFLTNYSHVFYYFLICYFDKNYNLDYFFQHFYNYIHNLLIY